MLTITHPTFRLNSNLLNWLHISRNQPAADRFNLFGSSASRYEKWSSSFSFNANKLWLSKAALDSSARNWVWNRYRIKIGIMYNRVEIWQDFRFPNHIYIFCLHGISKLTNPKSKSKSDLGISLLTHFPTPAHTPSHPPTRGMSIKCS